MRAIMVSIILCLLGTVSVAASDAKLTEGLELSNARQVGESLVTGGQPTADDLARLKERGVSLVVNLRRPGEETHHADPDVARRFNFAEEAAATALGLDYVNIPISSKDGLTRENAELLASVLAANDGKVLLHCGSGNRVGAMLALKAFYVDGTDAESAVAAGLQAGLTRLEPKVRAILGQE